MKVILEKKAAKYLERLNEPPQGDIKKLRSREIAYRLRIGDYRILYKEKTTLIAVYKIAHRGQAYKET